MISGNYQCIGGVPCESCRQRQIPCEVDEESDERRRIVLKRRLESLDRDRNLLLRLLEILKDECTTRTSGILNLIRSDASPEDIGSYLSEDLDLLEDSNVKYLQNSPLYHVPAKPWTRITQDDDFVSHLISLYFSWDHVVLGWIDRSLFLRDMSSGRQESRFCSPLLVNAILAVACVSRTG